MFEVLRDTPANAAGEVQVADALRRLLAAGGRVVALELGADERRHDIGTVESYCQTFIEFALADERFGAALRQHAAALLDAER